MAHNDLWAENVLIDRRGLGRGMQGGGLVIIDWPGASLRGFAIMDLIRLSRAFAVKGRRLRKEMAAHCGILGCELEDARSHLLAGLGNILTNREHFPIPLFLNMANGCLDRLESVGA